MSLERTLAIHSVLTEVYSFPGLFKPWQATPQSSWPIHEDVDLKQLRRNAANFSSEEMQLTFTASKALPDTYYAFQAPMLARITSNERLSARGWSGQKPNIAQNLAAQILLV